MKKRLLKIKWENLLLILFIPLAIIQLIKAHQDYKAISLFMSLLFYGTFYSIALSIRKEALLKAKDEIEKPIIKTLQNIIIGFITTKKRDYLNKRYINDQAYILRASFK